MIAGFVPVGFAASSAGEYTFSLFAVVSIALLVSWVVAVIFAPLLCAVILKPPDPSAVDKPSKVLELYRGFLTRAVKAKGLTIATTLAEMDRWGVQWGLVGVGDDEDSAGNRAVRQHPDRFVGAGNADPNEGMDGIRRIKRLKAEYDIRAVGCFPSGTFPQVPINDKKMYPYYACCVELDIPIFCCAGVNFAASAGSRS